MKTTSKSINHNIYITLLLALLLTFISLSVVFAEESSVTNPVGSGVVKESVNVQKEETIVITVDGESNSNQETDVGESEDGSDISLFSVDIQPPAAPSDLRAGMVTDTTVTIEWSPSLDNQGVANYIIYNNYVPIGETSSTSFVLESMSNEDTFLVTVRARDFAGNVSDSSGVLCLYHVEGSTVITKILTAPSNLEINRVWDNKLTLTWKINGDTEEDVEYEVYNGEVSIGKTKETSYVVTNLKNEEAYVFKVRVINLDKLVSGFSNVLAIYHVQEGDFTPLPLSPPTNVKIDSAGQNSVTLKWDVPANTSNIQGYVIYDEDRVVGTTSANSYIITGLVNEDTYVLTVKAKDLAGKFSDSSNVVLLYHINEDVKNPRSVTAQAAVNNNNVTVTGSALANNTVTMMVRNIQNNTIYTANTVGNSTDGGFNFNFVMPINSTAGTYTVTVGCEGTTTPAVTTFQYVIPSIKTITVEIGTNTLLSVSGSTNVGEGKTVSLNITKQGETTPIFAEAKTTATLTGGNFAFEPITLPENTINGTYTVMVVCEGVISPMTKTFTCELPQNGVITAQISLNDKVLTVNGTTNISGGKTVTLNITKQGESTPIYAEAKTTSTMSDGSFVFTPITLPETTTSGIYTVTVSCQGIIATATKTFIYGLPQDGAITANINLNDKVVTVSGVTNAGAGKAVTILVRDSNSKIVYIDQGVSGTINNFAFSFTMPSSAISGVYSILLGGEGVDVPTSKTFNYGLADGGTITAEVNLNNKVVTVNGYTDAGAGKAVTILVRDTNSKIVYIDQGVSGTDKSFVFSFAMPSTAESGAYELRVGGEGITAPLVQSFSYIKTALDSEFALLNANISIQNYIMTINGTVNCQESKKIVALVKDTTQNIVYLNEDISASDGDYSFTCTLPSLLNSATYVVEVKCYDIAQVGIETEIASLSSNISISNLLITVNGTANCQQGKRIVATVKETSANLINETKELTGEDGAYNFSSTIPSLLCVGTFDVDVACYEVTTPINQSVTSNVSVNGSTITVNGRIGSGANKNVTVLVRDRNQKIVYIDQGISGVDNSFEFIFTMPSNAISGVYTVLVGGEGVLAPVSKTFTYGGATYDDEITIAVDVNNKIVTVTGTTSFNGGKALSLNIVKQGESIPLFTVARTTLTLTGGSFSFESITMPDSAVVGQYSVLITPEGEQIPITKTFTYNSIDGGAITAQINVNGKVVTVNGTTDAGVGKAVTILVRDNAGKIVYIDQGVNDTNSSYQFIFTMASSAVSGEYIVLVGGDGVQTPTSLKFTYEADVQVPLTATVSVSDSQITVTGTTTVGAGKTVSLNITKQGETAPLFTQAKTATTLANGSFTFVIAATELPANGEYTVTVSAEGIQTPVIKNFVYPQTVPEVLTAPVLLPLQSSDVTDKVVILNWYGAQGGTGSIVYSIFINGDTKPFVVDITGINYKVQNLLPNTLYSFKVVAKDTGGNVAESNAISITTKENTVVNINNIEISCVEDKQYNIIVTGKNIKDIQNKIFSIEYNSAKLEVVDLCSLTKANDSVAGNIAGTDITITEFDNANGIIKFKLNKTFEGKQWTGVVNGIKFKSLENDETTTITQSIK